MSEYKEVATDVEKGEEGGEKKAHSKPIHKKSVFVHRRTCSACGHVSERETPLDIYPPPRPINHVHQQSKAFIGYVLVIAVVIFLTFVAVKYIT